MPERDTSGLCYPQGPPGGLLTLGLLPARTQFSRGCAPGAKPGPASQPHPWFSPCHSARFLPSSCPNAQFLPLFPFPQLRMGPSLRPLIFVALFIIPWDLIKMFSVYSLPFLNENSHVPASEFGPSLSRWNLSEGARHVFSAPLLYNRLHVPPAKERWCEGLGVKMPDPACATPLVAMAPPPTPPSGIPWEGSDDGSEKRKEYPTPVMQDKGSCSVVLALNILWPCSPTVQRLAWSCESQVEASTYVQILGGINLALHSWLLQHKEANQRRDPLMEAALSCPKAPENMDSEFGTAYIGLRGVGMQTGPSTHSWAFSKEEEVEILWPTLYTCVSLLDFLGCWVSGSALGLKKPGPLAGELLWAVVLAGALALAPAEL
ncbi:uncharacterized protein LOC123649443 [Lemur catta]|uniref:uncharacterized protein LOC123649443 n=1 Tax=Lemur catta TaxID=9447 RepID=UPI001E266B16|nr:uncharacterized protein LOC123649443 [Lemur catta]